MKIFIIFIFIAISLYSKSSDSIKELYGLEKQFKEINSNIDSNRSKIVILEDRSIENIYNIVFEQKYINLINKEVR